MNERIYGFSPMFHEVHIFMWFGYPSKLSAKGKSGKEGDFDDDCLGIMTNGCEVIPINKFHEIKSSLGSSMFVSCVRVVGLNFFIVYKLKFAIHVTTVKFFGYPNQNLLKNWSEKKLEPTSLCREMVQVIGGSSSRKRGTTVYSPSMAKGASTGFGTKPVIPSGGAVGISKYAIIFVLSTDTVYIFLHKTKQCNRCCDSFSSCSLR